MVVVVTTQILFTALTDHGKHAAPVPYEPAGHGSTCSVWHSPSSVQWPPDVHVAQQWRTGQSGIGKCIVLFMVADFIGYTIEPSGSVDLDSFPWYCSTSISNAFWLLSSNRIFPWG